MFRFTPIYRIGNHTHSATLNILKFQKNMNGNKIEKKIIFLEW